MWNRMAAGRKKHIWEMLCRDMTDYEVEELSYFLIP